MNVLMPGFRTNAPRRLPSLLLLMVVPTTTGLACEAGETLDAQAQELRFHSRAPARVDDGNDLVEYVAQCEAVLGPIPEISCDPDHPTPGTRVTKIPVFLNGKLLGFGHEDDATTLAERSAQDRYTCDFPSIGGDFPCTVGSTLIQYENPENPNVQWVGICRGVQRDNPSYDRFIGNGLIGANEKTGEMCFFFGSNRGSEEKPYVLPHLTSEAESSEALRPWLRPKDMPGSCLSCHPNNDPWLLTPWLQPSYMQTVLENPSYPLSLPPDVALEDVLAARFVRPTPTQYKALLPDAPPEGRTTWTEEEIFDENGYLRHRQYRAVGSTYVANEAAGSVGPRTGKKPESWQVSFRERLRLHTAETSCARGCHALGNENFSKLALDSLGAEHASAYVSDMMRIDGSVLSGWMPPYGGSKAEAQQAFARGEATVPAITECPIPKQLQSEPRVNVDCQERVITIAWEYLNDFGEVPGRDDVRFDVAVSDVDLAELDRGVSPAADLEGIAMLEAPGVTIARDVTTDPGTVADYSLEIPFDARRGEWAIDLQPKRFCFEEPDRRPFAYAPPYRVEIDVASECK